LLDSLEFERRGIPSTAIVTEEFVPGAKAATAMHGLPDYPFVILRHPLKNLSPNELEERADAALPQLNRLLTKAIAR